MNLFRPLFSTARMLSILVCFSFAVFANAATEQNPSKTSDITKRDFKKIVTALYPKAGNSPENLDKLLDFTMKSATAKTASTTLELPDSVLKIILRETGLTKEDLEYLYNTVVPLYQYTMENRNVPAESGDVYSLDTIARAPHDGCYYGLGDERNTYSAMGFTDEECKACKEDGGKVKTNGAYPWGVVTVGKKIFWGTVNNILCMPSWESMTSMQGNAPYENNCWVCEYNKGTRKNAGMSGDIERPRVFCYNTADGTVTDITPDTIQAPVLNDCLGLRSAGTKDGVVFIGGPGLDSDQGQTSTTSAFLAFDEDGNFLASSDMQDIDGCQITDVRRWVVVDDILYVGVALTDADGVKRGGVLRWYGDKEDPFQFHVVGYTKNEAGEICYHNGRLYAGGWPTANLQVAAIYEGPEIPEGGYTPENASEWPIMWTMAQYEPNKMNLQMEQCSMLHSYKGKLYWSMWYTQYGLPLSLTRYLGLKLASPKGMAALLAMLRQATLWRADTEQKNAYGMFSAVEMLYGEDYLPDYDYTTGEVSQPTNNVSSYKHVYGRAGFDRVFTAYDWATEIYNDKLFVGTMSTEQLIEPAISNNPDTATQAALQIIKYLLDVQEDNKGFELYYFKDGDSPAETVTQDAFGNHAQYGIRNMVLSEDGKYLYLGTASPMNLVDHGGWHILRYKEYGVPTSIDSDFKPAAILIRNNDGYMTFSSLNGEKIQNIQVRDLTGREVYNRVPVNSSAYLFQSQIGTGVYLVTVTTESGSWTTKVTMK